MQENLSLIHLVRQPKKQSSSNNHISRGMDIASNRIAMLEKITGKDISLLGPYEIIEENTVKGTRVEVVFN